MFRLSVGCPVLDQMLRGGLLLGAVTELAGESGSGKTQLALQLCLSVQFPTQYGGLNSGQEKPNRICAGSTYTSKSTIWNIMIFCINLS